MRFGLLATIIIITNISQNLSASQLHPNLSSFQTTSHEQPKEEKNAFRYFGMHFVLCEFDVCATGNISIQRQQPHQLHLTLKVKLVFTFTSATKIPCNTIRRCLPCHFVGRRALPFGNICLLSCIKYIQRLLYTSSCRFFCNATKF